MANSWVPFHEQQLNQCTATCALFLFVVSLVEALKPFGIYSAELRQYCVHSLTKETIVSRILKDLLKLEAMS